MFRTKALLGVLLVVSVVSISNAADIIYVDVNGPNEPGTGSYEDPFRRIQNAIDSADNNDTVIVAEGVYTGDPNNRDLHLDGKTITIRSTDPNDPNVVANTIIDPNGAGRGFYFHSGEDANCIISGLTIRNGYTGGYGASVYFYNSSPTIRNCIIKNGHAADSGGGLYCDAANPKIINCTITGNSAAFYGGGVSCYFSNPEIVGCIISDNSAVFEGGGLDLVLTSATVLNCIITNNKAASSGGVNCYSPGETILVNCTLTRNTATDSGGALFCQDGSSAIIKNSILWANEAASGPQVALDATGSVSISYSDVQDGWPGTGNNIDADPCFAAFDANGDPNLWDFHLQSVYGRWDPNSRSWVSDSNTSPCIDAGDPNSDWSNEAWPNGKRINMGCYGGTNQASMNGNMADFDIDRAVNFVDFAEFSNKWFTKESCIHDLGRDGVVNFADLRMFAENWLWQRE
jgi:predicted outer membrane repeat protein